MNDDGHSILDTVSFSQAAETLRTFNPQSTILEFLENLSPREKQVLVARYGLEDGESQTLEIIGKKLNLTRERIRQIEKDSLSKLGPHRLPENLSRGVDLIFKIIEDRGNAARETQILDSVLPANNNAVSRQGVLFILNLLPQFNLLKETPGFYQSWYLTGFDMELLKNITDRIKEILKQKEQAISTQDLMGQIRSGAGEEIENLSDEAIESYISMAKHLDKNPFGQWGLSGWSEIHPKDVGDKAHLVLAHHGQPEHYSKITELINKQGFDNRTAHKESVHNELIKDSRFVLVGRGIYALKEWGYQPGIVAEIIEGIMLKAARPLGRDEIIEELMKQRMVKKNTIIVGLANRKRFRKTADNKYTINDSAGAS